MSGLFYHLYLFCRRFPVSVLIGTVILLGLSVFSIFKIKLTENILDLVPKNKQLNAVSEIIESLEINNQITLHFQTVDSLKSSPEKLINAAETVRSNLNKDLPELVRDVKLKIDNSQLESAYEQIYENLPYYLTQEDYEKIAQTTTSAGIERAMASAFKSLNSPMGSFSSKYIIKDPLGLTFLPLERFKELSNSGGKISLYKDHLVTSDKRHLLAFAILNLSSSETLANAILIDSLDSYAANIALEYPDVQMSYFGASAVAVANAQQIRQDIYLTVGLASVFLLILILAYFKRTKVIFLVLLPGIFGALISGAILSLVNHSVSTVALAAGSALLGITIDYALHFLAHAKKSRSTKELYKDLTSPILICSITTASAFFSLILLGSQALSDLGFFAGLSVLFAALATLIFLPLFSGNLNLDHSKSKPSRVEQTFNKVAKKDWHKSKVAWVLIFLISIISCFTWQDYSFETDMLNLNYMPQNLEKSQLELNTIADYSKNTVYIASQGRTIDAALQKNAKLDSIFQELENEGLISRHLSFNSLIPSPSERAEKLIMWNAFWDKTGRQRVLNSIDSIAANYGFTPGIFHKLDSLINTQNISVTFQDFEAVVNLVGGGILLNKSDSNSVSVLSFAKVKDRDKVKLLNVLEQQDDLLILDQAHITTRLIIQLKEQFNKLVNISLLIVFIILLVSYGRIELAILAFIPTALSWFWILGIMGAFNLNFNIVNVIIGTFIFGLGIDYSVFQLRGLLQEYASAKAYVATYRQSILLSVITTLLGIGVLIFAKHPALKSIAALAMIGIGSVMLITFVVQPFLFDFFIANRKKKGMVPYTMLSFLQTCFAFATFLIGCLILNLVRLVLLIPMGSKVRKKIFFHKLLKFFCWYLVAVMLPKKRKLIHGERADFSNPRIIIANHHSFIDILFVLSLDHKVVILTNNWVYNSPFFGAVVRYADFLLASESLNRQIEKIRSLVEVGFSIVVFPEGTRSATNELKRFHKGAFYLAETLKIDVQPLLIHGTSQLLPKGDDFHLKVNRLTAVFLPPIAWDDPNYGMGCRERTKSISTHFKTAYYSYVDELENPDFFKDTIIKNYIYKGPVLEWYLRIKIRMEKNYNLFDKILPKEGVIIDLGCGYGFMSQALAFSAPEREILGVDYDREKIEIAKNVPALPANLTLKRGDVMDFSEYNAKAFIISDVLHYLNVSEQNLLLHNLSKNLLPGGLILIRDGDSSKQKRHRGSVLTEIFSTKSGFNKTRNELNFISSDFIRQFAEKADLDLEIVDTTYMTSNILFILKN